MHHRLIFPITLLCALLLTICPAKSQTVDRATIDSLQTALNHTIELYERGRLNEAKDSLDNVMRGTAHAGHLWENDDLTEMRLMCFRYYILINRELGDLETSNKWARNGAMIASKRCSTRSAAKLWGSIFVAEKTINEQILASQAEEQRLKEAIKKRTMTYVTVSALILALLLAILSFMFFKQRKAYRHMVRMSEEMASSMLSTVEPSGMEASQNNSLVSQIVEYMVKTKAYLNPDLSLNDLCQTLHTNRTYVSNVFNEMSTNFNAFVNKYRVSEAIKLITEHPEYNMPDIWVACGFNSQSTFYSCFKNWTGLTPSQFRKGTF